MFSEASQRPKSTVADSDKSEHILSSPSKSLFSNEPAQAINHKTGRKGSDTKSITSATKKPKHSNSKTSGGHGQDKFGSSLQGSANSTSKSRTSRPSEGQMLGHGKAKSTASQSSVKSNPLKLEEKRSAKLSKEEKITRSKGSVGSLSRTGSKEEKTRSRGSIGSLSRTGSKAGSVIGKITVFALYLHEPRCAKVILYLCAWIFSSYA